MRDTWMGVMPRPGLKHFPGASNLGSFPVAGHPVRRLLAQGRGREDDVRGRFFAPVGFVGRVDVEV